VIEQLQLKTLGLVALTAVVTGCSTIPETGVMEMDTASLCREQAALQPPNAVGRITIGVVTLGLSEFAEMARRQDRRVYDDALRNRGISDCAQEKAS